MKHSKQIIVTGGSGKVGCYVIEHLLSVGYQVLNLDLKPLPPPASDQVHTILVDLIDGSQVLSALSSHFKLDSPQPTSEPGPPTAVIHLAGYARNMIVPEGETFKGNVTSTWNVLEAACKLGVRKIVLASSICVYGVTYANGNADFASFPVDETVPPFPLDAYSMSKLCSETLARGFAARFKCDIYALRIGAVIAPNEYDTPVFQDYIDYPERWKVHGWSYTDVRDFGKMCRACVDTDGLGWQVFNAVNDEITNHSSNTVEFLQEMRPQTPITRPIAGNAAPICNAKLKNMLGFAQMHRWHDICGNKKSQ